MNETKIAELSVYEIVCKKVENDARPDALNLDEQRNLHTFIVWEEGIDEFLKWVKASKYAQGWYCLHSKCKNADGTLKKRHIHVLVYFGAKARISGRRLIKMLGHLALFCQFDDVKSKEGVFMYLCHANAKDKYQYNPEDVVTFGGAENYAQKLQALLQKAAPVYTIDDFVTIAQQFEVNNMYEFTKLLREHFQSMKNDFYKLSWPQQRLLESIMAGRVASADRMERPGYMLYDYDRRRSAKDIKALKSLLDRTETDLKFYTGEQEEIDYSAVL